MAVSRVRVLVNDAALASLNAPGGGVWKAMESASEDAAREISNRAPYDTGDLASAVYHSATTPLGKAGAQGTVRIDTWIAPHFWFVWNGTGNKDGMIVSPYGHRMGPMPWKNKRGKPVYLRAVRGQGSQRDWVYDGLSAAMRMNF